MSATRLAVVCHTATPQCVSVLTQNLKQAEIDTLAAPGHAKTKSSQATLVTGLACCSCTMPSHSSIKLWYTDRQLQNQTRQNTRKRLGHVATATHSHLYMHALCPPTNPYTPQQMQQHQQEISNTAVSSCLELFLRILCCHVSLSPLPSILEQLQPRGRPVRVQPQVLRVVRQLPSQEAALWVGHHSQVAPVGTAQAGDAHG